MYDQHGKNLNDWQALIDYTFTEMERLWEQNYETESLRYREIRERIKADKPTLGQVWDAQSYWKEIGTLPEPFGTAEDMEWRITNRLIPYIQFLDDIGLIRSMAFMIGGFVGSEYMEPAINDFMKLTGKTFPAKTKKNLQDTLNWGSRWFTGVPIYEFSQMALYPEQDFVRSTPQTPIFWKHEFWGTKKKFQVKYWDLGKQNYNYKHATMALRNHLKGQGYTLEKIGEYSQFQ